jgi:hypothetical protein
MTNRGLVALFALSGTAACGGASDFDRQHVPDTLGMFTVWAFAPDDVWAAGSTATIRWDGEAWTDVASPIGGALDIHGLAPDDVWTVNGTSVAHWDGAAWEVHDLEGQGFLSSLATVWEIAPDDVWVGGAINGEALHWDGATWTLTITQAIDISEMWASGPDDVWAIGLGGVMRRTGGVWTESQDVFGTSEGGLWGFGPDDVWATDDFGTVSHFDGVEWTTTEVEGSDFTAIWGTATDDLWAVGSSGSIGRWDGSEWDIIANLGYDHYLNAVHGSGAGDVWVVGTDQGEDFAGVVLRYEP